MDLVLATFNRDKARELRALLGAPDIKLHTLHEYPGATAPPEVGKSLLENARVKAQHAARLTGLTSIGDDTGLEVDSLGGKPGIYAARFAGPNATYETNLRRLLEVMVGVEGPRRTARFRTVMVAINPRGVEVIGEGTLEGRITESPRGRNGFGYDPVFEIPTLGRTLAELAPEEKARISHRALAARALATKLGLI
jgi:XTP/dITP diphosphohydrolase